MDYFGISATALYFICMILSWHHYGIDQNTRMNYSASWVVVRSFLEQLVFGGKTNLQNYSFQCWKD